MYEKFTVEGRIIEINIVYSLWIDMKGMVLNEKNPINRYHDTLYFFSDWVCTR